jgi:aquaporin Z
VYNHKNMKSYISEFVGTMLLVLCGVGTFLFAFGYVGFMGVAVAFGITYALLILSLGSISGGHFNPAVTFASALAGNISKKEVMPYIGAQLAGSTLGMAILYAIAQGIDGFTRESLSSVSNVILTGISVPSAFAIEMILSAVACFVAVRTVSHKSSLEAYAVSMGAVMTLVHLFALPLTKASVNPARSFGTALFAGGEAVSLLWLFLFAPMLGAVVAAFAHKKLQKA